MNQQLALAQQKREKRISISISTALISMQIYNKKKNFPLPLGVSTQSFAKHNRMTMNNEQ